MGKLGTELFDCSIKFARVNLEEQDGMHRVRRLMLSHRKKISPGFLHRGSMESESRRAKVKEKQRGSVSNHSKTAGGMHFGVKKRGPLTN